MSLVSEGILVDGDDLYSWKVSRLSKSLLQPRNICQSSYVVDSGPSQTDQEIPGRPGIFLIFQAIYQNFVWIRRSAIDPFVGIIPLSAE